MSEIPEVFAIFEQKLAHVLSFTVAPLKSKVFKNELEEILTYFSGIVERASKAESRIAELEAENDRLQFWLVSAGEEIDQLTAHSDIERQDDKSSNDTQTSTIVYGKERD